MRVFKRREVTIFMMNLKKSVCRESRIKNISFCVLFYTGSLIFLSNQAICQGLPSGGLKNAIYIDLASRGPVYSINYDRIFFRSANTGYSFRVGLSLEKDAFSIPLGLSMITGSRAHHAEFSLGFIPYVDHYKKSSDNLDVSDKYVYINSTVGYRYQESKSRLFFRVAFGPGVLLDPPSEDFWNMDPKLYAFGSLGIGISF